MKTALAVTLTLGALLLTTPGAVAADRLPEVERLAELRAGLDDLLARYEALEQDAGRAWLRVAEAERAVRESGDLVRQAEERLNDRIRTIYQLGPGSTLDALLGAGSFADLATIGFYGERTLALDGAALRDSVVADAILVARRSEAEAARAQLGPRLTELRTLLAEMERAVAEAMVLAERARIDERERRELEAQREAIAAAATRQGSWDLGVIDYQQDQSHLLALLGPSGGQTCETPPGLVETGESFSGYASWYGWEFGGSRRPPVRSSTRRCSRPRTAGCRSGRSFGCATRVGARWSSSTTADPTAGSSA